MPGLFFHPKRLPLLHYVSGQVQLPTIARVVNYSNFPTPSFLRTVRGVFCKRGVVIGLEREHYLMVHIFSQGWGGLTPKVRHGSFTEPNCCSAVGELLYFLNREADVLDS